jgi:hypothetical protein
MSAVLARRVEETLRKKESAESYKANLQRLQAEGAVTQENYSRMLQGYDKNLADASKELNELAALISREIERNERELAGLRQELAALEVRRNVGELNQAQFERTSRPLEKRIHVLEASRDLCLKLQRAKSRADLPSPGSRLPAVLQGRSALGGRHTWIPEWGAFSEFSSIEEMTTPRSKVVGLASGLLLLLSVLANWISYELTIAGSDVSAWLLFVGLLGAVAAIYGSLLVQPRARGFLHLAVATLGLLVVFGVLLTLTFKDVSVFQLGGTKIQIGRRVLHFREGFYLYLLALAGMIYYGYKEMTAER